MRAERPRRRSAVTAPAERSSHAQATPSSPPSRDAARRSALGSGRRTPNRRRRGTALVSAQGLKPPATLAIGAITAMAVIGLAALSAVLAVIVARDTCSSTGMGASPSAGARKGIPARYLSLYRQAAGEAGVPWPALAAIESDHGRSRAAGVRSGVNRHGCCAGPMQFNTRDGPPSTWARYGVDGNDDGTEDVYDPEDVIPSAANYLATLRRANGNLTRAIFADNHSVAYVRDVLARARVYAHQPGDELTAPVDDTTARSDCANDGLDVTTGPANLRDTQRIATPRAYRTLPAWTQAPGRGAATVDARLYDDVVWVLRRCRLRVSAAREAGHHTHGDGTAVDLVPADGSTQAVWDASAGRLAHDLGWTRACAHSGTRPACRLAPAIQFTGYDGYPNHGSPRTCSGECPAHLHLSWVSPCYGSSRPSPPCQWVMAFAVLPTDLAVASRPGS
jgi:membrane-bound lytic murein transglycosylase B